MSARGVTRRVRRDGGLATALASGRGSSGTPITRAARPQEGATRRPEKIYLLFVYKVCVSTPAKARLITSVWCGEVSPIKGLAFFVARHRRRQR